RYEEFMRRQADATPPVRMSVLRRANPQSRRGIGALHAGARIVASPAGRAAMNLLGKRLVNVAADGMRLPDYPPAR
ncbi:MAG: FAD-dependent oxidoreductase, partial [Mycobacterium sp.]|nr:FAD-dependent oxidoreductase [Mycobacterium sp.]